MKLMTSSAVETVDLLDLKLLPAWVKEPADSKSYADYTEEEDRGAQKRWRGAPRGKPKHRTPINREQASDSDKSRASIQHPIPKVERRYRDGLRQRSGARDDRPRGSKNRRRLDRHPQFTRTPSVTVRFLPYSLAFENVVAQIKSGSVAYSVFALARLFLEKPVGYEVYVAAKPHSPLFQLGENGTVSVDREFLERNSFRFAQRDFYQMDVVETDPIKGNFSNVARCRLSGTLLGPTNYHNYQPQLRSLYEQRFSRRMSFADYQRQIDVMSDAELIERWKEEARKITTYTTLREASSLKFSSALEAERHFRSHYLPGLIRDVGEATFGGGLSRRLPDRMLNQAIEEAWMRETRSPSDMMQELAGRFRQNGLHVFRHRRGMLFISPIRPRAFAYEQAGVSPSVNAILEALGSAQRSTGKQLFERLIRDSAGEHAEARSLAVASDLRWLINEGYVIEFNDGSLDLPRRKSKQQQETVEALAAASAGAVDTTTSTRSWPLQLTWPEQ
ncbi:MAG: hypothetical protein DME82_05335 [Verrucomicrobia bacterium]|nr:MAG: hypothetical protein DME82_05335 [Verrucomicrobiota bacterium]